jgi:peroxiredoxin
MTIRIGDHVPSCTLRRMTDDGVSEITTDEIFSGKRVVLFALPGAFTPVCSGRHLPGFIEQAGAIHARGIDRIACLSVNDAFVMDAWGRAQGVDDKILMLADGNGEFTTALGLELDASALGLGLRSRRYAMIVDDGVVRELAIDEPAQLNASSAEAILAKL